jgi:hypothetical protein
MMVHTANTLGSPLIYFKKAAVPDLVLTVDPGVNYIWATYTSAGGGTITYSANAARPTEDYHVFVVGRALRIGSDVEVITTGQNIYNQYGRMQDRLLTKYGSMDHATGAVISAHATPLQLQCTGSKWYFGNTLIDLSAVAPNTFQVWYKTGGGAWTKSSSLTLFSEVFDGGTSKVYETYQNGTSLASLGASKYGVYWVFMCPEGELYVVLGAATYANVGAAQAATVPANLPDYCVDWARLIGRVIIQNSAAAFYSVESVFSTSFTLSAAVDHASLSGLTAADSHPQAAITGLTTADGPTFSGLVLTDGAQYRLDSNVDAGGNGDFDFVVSTAYPSHNLCLGKYGTSSFDGALRLKKGGSTPVYADLTYNLLDSLQTTGGPTFDHIHASVTLCPVVEIAAAEPVGRDNGHLWYDSDATATGYSIDVLMVEIFSGG